MEALEGGETQKMKKSIASSAPNCLFARILIYSSRLVEADDKEGEDRGFMVAEFNAQQSSLSRQVMGILQNCHVNVANNVLHTPIKNMSSLLTMT